jgi:hypothetical protein
MSPIVPISKKKKTYTNVGKVGTVTPASTDVGLNWMIKVNGTYNIRGPFSKFVDSPYYSKLKLCGDVVMVPFLKYLLSK